MRRHWFAAAVVAVALVAAGGHRAGAGHRGGEFSAVVFPKGVTAEGAYVSGKCMASVDVGAESVSLMYCTFVLLGR